MKLQNKNIDIIKKRDYTLIIEREKNDLNGNARYKVIAYDDGKLYKDDGSLNEYYVFTGVQAYTQGELIEIVYKAIYKEQHKGEF